ncbi:MAG: inositol monophosphatase family protein [Nitrososphaerota archaeon]
MEPGELIRSALTRAMEVYRDLARKGTASQRVRRGSFGDMAMVADLMCEEAIMRELARSLDLRRCTVVAEESGIINAESEQELVVLIDPVDGSTNMRRGMRHFGAGIAIASSSKFRDVFAAGVLDFVSGELVLATEDNVVLPEGSKGPSNVEDLRESVVTLDFRAAKRGPRDVERYLRLVRALKHVRNLGSSLVELEQIALGVLDAYVCITPEMRVFDIVPGMYVLKKLGCPLWTGDGDPEELELVTRNRYPLIAASNRTLLQRILEEIS